MEESGQIKGTGFGGRFKEVMEIEGKRLETEPETNECETRFEENLKDERKQKRRREV